MSILERDTEGKSSKVRARVIDATTKAVLHAEARKHVEPGSALYTDAHGGYRGLSNSYKHESVDHAVEYVRDNVHMNGMENFWSLLKRGLKGTYISVEPYHVFRYIDEQILRFNKRKLSDFGRFTSVLTWVGGLRLIYKELIGDDGEALA